MRKTQLMYYVHVCVNDVCASMQVRVWVKITGDQPPRRIELKRVLLYLTRLNAAKPAVPRTECSTSSMNFIYLLSYIFFYPYQYLSLLPLPSPLHLLLLPPLSLHYSPPSQHLPPPYSLPLLLPHLPPLLPLLYSSSPPPTLHGTVL